MKQVLETAGEVYSGFETVKQWVGAFALLVLGGFTLVYPLESAQGFSEEMPAWLGRTVTYGSLSLGGLMLFALVMPESIAYRARSLMFLAVVLGILVFVGFRLEPILREIHDLKGRGVGTVAVRIEQRAKVWPRKPKNSSSILLRYDGRTRRISLGLDVPVGGTIPILVDPENPGRMTPGDRCQGWFELLRQRLGIGWLVGGAVMLVIGALTALYLVANLCSGPPRADTTNAP